MIKRTYIFFLLVALAPGLSYAGSLPYAWPPLVGQSYPDLEMTDQNGDQVKLSSFKGKILLIEPIGMNCPACLAWSGTQRHGAFQGLAGQPGINPFEDSFKTVTGISLPDSRIVQIQILFFSTSMMPTTAADAKAWASHFHRDRRKNQIVLAGSANFLQPGVQQATYNLVPGYQLVDQNFILRSDSTSDNPKTDLWRELVPMLSTLLKT